MQITKSNSIQALPILFLIFLFQTLFFIYIDEGYYSFDALATVDGVLGLGLWTSVFTLIGFTLFSIFNKKGNFKGNIHLSNEGLLGKGNLSYSGTQVDSEDLIFKPDRVKGSAEYFHLEEDKANSVPEVKGYDVTIDWKPYEDSMTVASKDKSFQLFNEGEHEIGGVLISTPTGLKGRGIFQWGEGEMGANLFNFGAHQVQSEKTDLKIKSLDNDALAFDTKNLKGSIDFETNKGQFKSNEKGSLTKMPANFFVTTLNEFEWDLGKKALTFVAEPGKKGNFISILTNYRRFGHYLSKCFAIEVF